jgi:hypothetical protein
MERWHSDAFENRQIANKIFEDLKNKLKIIPHNFNGWRSFPNQNLETILINENGLRNKSIKDLKKTKNCLLLGGSVAWGFGASSNKNIPSYQIEKILERDYNINLNIINLAEQSYTSIEELNSFIFSFYELNPSAVIILSGCNDIGFEFENNYKKIFLYEDLLNFFLWGDKLGIFREKKKIHLLIKVILRLFKKNKTINEEFFYFKRPHKDEIANNMYGSKIDFIKNFCEQKKIQVFNFLQPDLLFKKNKSNFEKDYEKFVGEEKKEFIIKKYKFLEEKFFKIKNNTSYFKNYSLLNCFDEFKETIFFDRSHLADFGNNILARKISSFISSNLKK